MPLFLKKHAIRHTGGASVAPCILNLGTRWR